MKITILIIPVLILAFFITSPAAAYQSACGVATIEACASACESASIKDGAAICTEKSVKGQNCCGVCGKTAMKAKECCGVCGKTAMKAKECCGVCGKSGVKAKDCCGICGGSCSSEKSGKAWKKAHKSQCGKNAHKNLCTHQDHRGCGEGKKVRRHTKKARTCREKQTGAKVWRKQVKPANISTNELKSLLESGKQVTVLDARTGIYDDGRRIPGAKTLNDKSSAAEIKAIIPDRNSLVVTYCSNLKCPASDKLAQRLIELGYTNIIEYPFGIQGWTRVGFPVHHSK